MDPRRRPLQVAALGAASNKAGGGAAATATATTQARLQRDQAGEQAERNKTTDAQTMMHILKANIGTGVLAMPGAFKQVGLWPGLLLVPLLGAVCIHCMNMLLGAHNQLCDRYGYESLDYDQVAALALASGPRWARRWARQARVLVLAFLIVTQIGFCCVYVMFVAENVQVVCLNLWQLDYSLSTYLCLVFPVIGLSSCTSNLKHLARISTLANALQLAGLSLIVYDLALVATHEQPEAPAGPSNSTAAGPLVEQWLDGPRTLAGLPIFFATAVYAFEGIGVVLPLVKEMRHPERIAGPAGVLNSSMFLVALLYMAVGFFGYAKYGRSVQGSITLNLPETSLNELVRLVFALAIGLSYSLQFYVPWTILWPAIDESLFYSYRPRHKLDVLLPPPGEPWPASGDSAGGPLELEQSGAATMATSYATNAASSLARPGARYGALAPRDRLAELARPAPGPRRPASAMPEVHWRPPPRSMRGKRKLVRYTVILLTVSLTFVAAALIPRLDLFISLIGALASSCLAIIFPALLELCTFWNRDPGPHCGEPEQSSDDEDEHEHDDQHQHHQDPNQKHQRDHKNQPLWPQTGALRRARRQRLRWARARLLCKDLLLVAFGLAGLLTGGWTSIAQLGAIYAAGPAA